MNFSRGDRVILASGPRWRGELVDREIVPGTEGIVLESAGTMTYVNWDPYPKLIYFLDTDCLELVGPSVEEMAYVAESVRQRNAS